MPLGAIPYPDAGTTTTGPVEPSANPDTRSRCDDGGAGIRRLSLATGLLLSTWPAIAIRYWPWQLIPLTAVS